MDEREIEIGAIYRFIYQGGMDEPEICNSVLILDDKQDSDIYAILHSKQDKMLYPVVYCQNGLPLSGTALVSSESIGELMFDKEQAENIKAYSQQKEVISAIDIKHRVHEHIELQALLVQEGNKAIDERDPKLLSLFMEVSGIAELEISDFQRGVLLSSFIREALQFYNMYGKTSAEARMQNK